MSTPGTPQWLREQADRILKEHAIPNLTETVEGMKRAANRIERLQGQLSKQRTGVDQTKTPVTVNDTVISIYLPEDDALYTRVFEWVVDSGAYLDPCIITVDGPVRAMSTERRTLVEIEMQGRHFDRVQVRGSDDECIDLADCRAHAIGDDGKGDDRIRIAGRRM